VVDVVDATDADLDVVAQQLVLHPLAMEDARKHGQRAKLETYPTHSFLVAYSGGLAEVDLFIGRNWAVMVRGEGPRGLAWDPSPALARFHRLDASDPDIGTFVYIVLDELVDGYFTALDATEDLLEHMEDRIFSEERSDEREIQQELFVLRREFLGFRRAIVPLRDVIASLLRGEVPWFDGEALVRLQDVYDHVLRAVDAVDIARELMGNAVDAHLAIISNRVNQVMKTMTSWGAILFGASLIAGIYGMNFEHMPELSWRAGYPLALGMMAVMTLVLVRLFRRRGWL
jgi:magnesium transporter